MDSHVFSTPLPRALEGVHYDTPHFLGSEHSNLNAAYGYIEHRKPRWTQQVREYQDVGAMEKFGIDPTRPTPLGVTVTADPYGFPIDGYTTGYTMKLPPPADKAVADRTPRSFNSLSVIAQSDGSETTWVPPNLNMDNPSATWNYGTNTGGMDTLNSITKLAQQVQALARNAGVDPATLATILRQQQERPSSTSVQTQTVVQPTAETGTGAGAGSPASDASMPGAFPSPPDQFGGGVMHTAPPQGGTADLTRGVIRTTPTAVTPHPGTLKIQTQPRG